MKAADSRNKVESRLLIEVSQPVIGRAIDFFMLNYIPQSTGQVRGYYDYLSHFVANHDATDRKLAISLRAVAIAAYASALQSQELLYEARRQVGIALRLVHAALSLHEEAVKDSTIVSIILLKTFGIIMSQDSQSLVDCDAHTNGGVETTKLRGRRSLETQQGLHLFLHMCSLSLQNCIFHSVQLSTQLLELRKYAEELVDPEEPAWRLSKVMVEVADFRANVKSNVFQDMCRIVQEALDIDSKLIALEDDLRESAQWGYEIIVTPRSSSAVYGSYFHVYPDFQVAHIWNDIRTCRLLLHKEIGNQLCDQQDPLRPPLPLTSGLCPLTDIQIDCDQPSLSRKISEQIILEICASVPHLCNAFPSPSSSDPLESTHGKDPDAPNTRHKIPLPAGLYSLLWPLYSAGTITESASLRNWIIHQCRLLGQLTGIQQALALADFLEKGIEVCV